MLYLVGAALIAFVGNAFERFGPRQVVLVGMSAMGAAAIGLTWITHLWQLYLVFPLTAAGWATMSGAALNPIVAPWFERRRGLGISLAFNGAAVGGVLLAPALVFLIGRIGFRAAVLALVTVMVGVLTRSCSGCSTAVRKSWGWRRTAMSLCRRLRQRWAAESPRSPETSCVPGTSGRWRCRSPWG